MLENGQRGSGTETLEKLILNDGLQLQDGVISL